MGRVYNNQLICYYADQRDSRNGQKLSHQTTTDLVSWSSPVDDVRDASNYAARPGMPAIVKLPNNNYIFAYEMCGTDGCRVHYRITNNPLNVAAAADITLRSTAGTVPTSSPYVVWTSVGGANGTIILSGGSQSAIFTNRALGASNAWVQYNTPQPNAYSRGLAVFQNDANKLAIIGGGWLPPSSTNQVSISVIDIGATIGA